MVKGIQYRDSRRHIDYSKTYMGRKTLCYYLEEAQYLRAALVQPPDSPVLCRSEIVARRKLIADRPHVPMTPP